MKRIGQFLFKKITNHKYNIGKVAIDMQIRLTKI